MTACLSRILPLLIAGFVALSGLATAQAQETRSFEDYQNELDTIESEALDISGTRSIGNAVEEYKYRLNTLRGRQDRLEAVMEEAGADLEALKEDVRELDEQWFFDSGDVAVTAAEEAGSQVVGLGLSAGAQSFASYIGWLITGLEYLYYWDVKERTEDQLRDYVEQQNVTLSEMEDVWFLQQGMINTLIGDLDRLEELQERHRQTLLEMGDRYPSRSLYPGAEATDHAILERDTDSAGDEALRKDAVREGVQRADEAPPEWEDGGAPSINISPASTTETSGALGDVQFTPAGVKVDGLGQFRIGDTWLQAVGTGTIALTANASYDLPPAGNPEAAGANPPSLPYNGPYKIDLAKKFLGQVFVNGGGDAADMALDFGRGWIAASGMADFSINIDEDGTASGAVYSGSIRLTPNFDYAAAAEAERRSTTLSAGRGFAVTENGAISYVTPSFTGFRYGVTPLANKERQTDRRVDGLTLEEAVIAGVVLGAAITGDPNRGLADMAGIAEELADAYGVSVGDVQTVIDTVTTEIRETENGQPDNRSIADDAANSGTGGLATAAWALTGVSPGQVQIDPPTLEIDWPEEPPATAIMTEMEQELVWVPFGGTILQPVISHESPNFSASGDPRDDDGNPQTAVDAIDQPGGSQPPPEPEPDPSPDPTPEPDPDPAPAPTSGTAAIFNVAESRSDWITRELADIEFMRDSDNGLTSFSTAFDTYERGSAQSVDRTSTADPTSPIFIERWTNGTFDLSDTATPLAANQGLHFAYREGPTPDLPTAGTANYQLWAATKPTYNTGATAPGTLTEASMAVNFAPPPDSGDVMIDFQIAIAMPDFTYQARTIADALTSDPGPVPVSIFDGATFGLTMDIEGGRSPDAGLACAGTSLCQIQIDGFFAGSDAGDAGILYNTFNGTDVHLSGSAILSRMD